MKARCEKCKPRAVVLYKTKCEKCDAILVFGCIKCNLEFKNREDLRLHIYTVCFKLSYMCPKCDKIFARDNSLKMHIKICSQKKKLTHCWYCV